MAASHPILIQELIIPSPAFNDLQTQLHGSQSSLASYVDKIWALEGVLAKHEAIKHEVSLLRSLVEGSKGSLKVKQDEEIAR